MSLFRRSRPGSADVERIKSEVARLNTLMESQSRQARELEQALRARDERDTGAAVLTTAAAGVDGAGLAATADSAAVAEADDAHGAAEAAAPAGTDAAARAAADNAARAAADNAARAAADAAAQAAALAARVEAVAAQLDALDARLTAVSGELAAQLGELGSELDTLHRGDGAAVDEETIESLRDGQLRLANEQVRYQIAFREDLARLADQLRRP